jgi:serine/threonine protein kinase
MLAKASALLVVVVVVVVPIENFLLLLLQGGFGFVVAAVETATGRSLAVKKTPEVADKEESLNEAQTLAGLESPFVVELVFFFPDHYVCCCRFPLLILILKH